jgi:ligand-binding SRPBCC domain-containing protein
MSIIQFRFENEFRLSAEMVIPNTRDQLFPYFSTAHNLEEITPSFLKFKVLSSEDLAMEAGTVIDYSLRLHGVPLRWKSLISHWDPPYRFVDEQLRGPYRYWIHEHIFEEQGSSVLVKDLVRYQVYGGKLFHDAFVKRDLMRIFQFRQEKLAAVFS